MEGTGRKSELDTLLGKYLRNKATASEAAFIEEYYDIFEYKESVFENTSPEEKLALENKMLTLMHEKTDSLQSLTADLQSADVTPMHSAPIHRVYFLRKWGWAAASIILVLGTGVYLRTANKENIEAPVIPVSYTDVEPGKDGVILTLADGRKIALDNASNGQLAQQGNAQVVKLADGEIVYKVNGISEEEVMWNTMSTPVGGQYQVTLPDGTRVWLNAASSITYPAAFVDAERKVTVTGEVYLEVAKNKAKPFKVDIDGKSQIEVLGTSFNINSYANEANIKTTLIEGSVKVIKGDENVILKPGQQVQINNTSAVSASSGRQLEVVNADLSQTIAWKNGLFSFNNADLPSAMRQLERWYDIQVKYEGKSSDIILDGKMFRNIKLSDVLEFLGRSGVKFKMEGKTLIVTE